MARPGPARGAWALALLAAAQAAPAAELRVAPVRLSFAAGERVQELVLSNAGASPVLLELQAWSWQQPDTERALAPSHALLPSPPIVEVPAGASRTVRVGFREPFAATAGCEQAYRLWITELPDAQASAPLRMRTRISLPVFRRGPEPCAAQLRWRRRGELLELHNAGDGTVQLQSLTLGRGDAATPLALPALGYLLPGTRWQLSLPAGLAAAPLAPQARDAEGPVPLLAADD